MTPDQFIQRVDSLIDGFPREAERLLVASAGTAKDVIENRVTQQGLNAKGQTFTSIKDYGPRYKLKKAGLKVRDIKQANVTLSRRLESDRPVSDRLLDRAIGAGGRYRGFVDLTYSGRMWANIKVLETSSSNTESRVSVGAQDLENKKKLEGNTSGNGKWPGRGEILAVNKNEERELARTFEEDITLYVERAFEL